MQDEKSIGRRYEKKEVVFWQHICFISFSVFERIPCGMDALELPDLFGNPRCSAFQEYIEVSKSQHRMREYVS